MIGEGFPFDVWLLMFLIGFVAGWINISDNKKKADKIK